MESGACSTTDGWLSMAAHQPLVEDCLHAHLSGQPWLNTGPTSASAPAAAQMEWIWRWAARADQTTNPLTVQQWRMGLGGLEPDAKHSNWLHHLSFLYDEVMLNFFREGSTRQVGR